MTIQAVPSVRGTVRRRVATCVQKKKELACATGCAHQPRSGRLDAGLVFVACCLFKKKKSRHRDGQFVEMREFRGRIAMRADQRQDAVSLILCLCADMCIDTRVDMCKDMCKDMGYRHGYRHMRRRVRGHICVHVPMAYVLMAYIVRPKAYVLMAYIVRPMAYAQTHIITNML